MASGVPAAGAGRRGIEASRIGEEGRPVPRLERGGVGRGGRDRTGLLRRCAGRTLCPTRGGAQVCPRAGGAPTSWGWLGVEIGACCSPMEKRASGHRVYRLTVNGADSEIRQLSKLPAPGGQASLGGPDLLGMGEGGRRPGPCSLGKSPIGLPQSATDARESRANH
jgi:hypothetical protein